MELPGMRRAMLLTAGLCLGACAGTQQGGEQAEVSASGQAATSGAQLSAHLTGGEERPGPGDPDGTGHFSARIDNGQLCYDLRVQNVATATAAHVHKAPPGQAGPPVVALITPASGGSSGCAAVDAVLAADLLANPQAYYVNVHNAEVPPGAASGQLMR